MTSTYGVERIRTVEALEALESEWRRIEDAQPLPLPFFSWEWAVS